MMTPWLRVAGPLPAMGWRHAPGGAGGHVTAERPLLSGRWGMMAKEEREGGGCGQDVPFDYHVPVLPAEVIEGLAPAQGKVFLDGTLGGGGHAERLLEAGARVIGLDQDAEAIAFASRRLARFGDRFVAVQANFRELAEVLAERRWGPLDGILVDLGVSSWQLDEASRGFSFQQDGPLDMRMNPSTGRSAAELVNEAEEEELARIFWEYGEMKLSRRLARALVRRREVRRFETTGDLASFVASVLPKHGKTHPATLCFQALRIAVNDELGALAVLLEEARHWLKPGGRLAVISFHSLEDRMVKRALQRFAAEWLDRPEWPAPRPNPEFCMKVLTRKPVEASEGEVKHNARARSARLRVAERVATP